MFKIDLGHSLAQFLLILNRRFSCPKLLQSISNSRLLLVLRSCWKERKKSVLYLSADDQNKSVCHHIKDDENSFPVKNKTYKPV